MVTPNNSLSLSEILHKIDDFESLARTDFTHLQSESIVGIDFSIRTLDGANFSHMILPHLQASEAKLVSASFQGTDLSHACFAGADIRGADFTNATVTFADFSGAKLDGARFSNCIGIESTNLPDAIKKAYRDSDPVFRRFALIRASIIGGGLVALSGALLFFGAANWFALGSGKLQLDQLNHEIAQQQNLLAQVKADQKAAQEEKARIDENIASERKLLARIKDESWQQPKGDSSVLTALTRETTNDLAGSLDQLLNERPSSVQKYVLYFESLKQIEMKYGPTGRNEVVKTLISKNNEPYQTGFREFLRISTKVKGPVSQAQIEQILKDRYDHIDSGREDKQTFWTFKSDWTRYWTEQFVKAGML